MNILIVSHEYPPIGGGGANACFFLSREFAQTGHQITIVTAQYENMPIEEKTSDGVLIYRVRCKRKNKEKSNIYEMFTYLVNAWKMTEKLLKTSKFDMCLTFFGIPSGPIALHLKRKYRLPYVIRFGGGDIPGAQKRFKYVYMVLSPIIRSIWKNAESLIANSEGLCKRAQRFEDKYKIDVITNGVDSQFFFPKEREKNEQEIKILFVSRLIEGKGLQYIIPDMPKIQKEIGCLCNKKVKLIIVGDGSYRADLEELVRKTQADGCVSFEGRKNKEQIRQYYQDADIFILPSLSEGMPNVVLEAMACGLPIIMTPCEGSKELVTDNGMISSIDTFAHSLVKMCVDMELRQTMGQNSRIHVEKNFKWENIGRIYLTLLEGKEPTKCEE